MTRPHLRHSAFTLIELLVVIAIIGLLTAILVPSLAGAREKSRNVICSTNLRSLAHGWHMYADENHDIILPGRYGKWPGGTTNPQNWIHVGNGKKYRPRWIATLGKYVNLYAFDEPRTDTDRQDYNGGVYRCPTVPEWIDERNHAFGYNHQFLGNTRRTNGKYHNFPVNRSRITHFASTVMAGDCLGTAAGIPRNERIDCSRDKAAPQNYRMLGNHGWTLDPPRLTAASDRGTGDVDSPRAGLDPRHRGRSNVVFCDGHARSVRPEELGYRFLPDGRCVDLEVVEDPPNNRFFGGENWDKDPPNLPE